MLVPLPKHFGAEVQKVAQCLSEVLHPPDSLSHRTIVQAWEAFQAECALEVLFYGKLLHRASTAYSINLGPGDICPSRAISDELEFMALSLPTVCQASDSELPPCRTWVKHPQDVRI